MGGMVYMGLILPHVNELDTNQTRKKLPGALGSDEAFPWFMWTNPPGLSAPPEAEPTGSPPYGVGGQNRAVKGMRMGWRGALTQGGAKSVKWCQTRT